MLITNNLVEQWKKIDTAIKGLKEEKQQLRKQIKELVPVVKQPKPRKIHKPRVDVDKNKERTEKMVSLFKEGKTHQEIGELFGFSKQYVQQVLKKHGLGSDEGGCKVRKSNRICLVDGCSIKGNFTKGYCQKHYAKLQTHGDPLKITSRDHDPICKVDGCDKPFSANGFCNTHRMRWYKTGSAGSAEINPVGKHKNRGKQAKLSDSQKAEIKSLYRLEKAVSGVPNEFSHSSLAKRFNVTPATIAYVLKNK